MIEQKFKDVLFEEEKALIHDEYIGFKEDYLVLHSLLRKYYPNTVTEVGTNIGSGVNVIATALPHAKIYSLDLDFETMKQDSLQYPVGSEGEDRVGSAARFPYTQLRGDSKTFNYSQYKSEAYYIDGEHTYDSVYKEVKGVLRVNPKLVIFHDSDMPEVYDGIIEGFKYSPNGDQYQLYRVIDTRICYAVRK